MRIFLKKTLSLAQLINGHLLKKIELSEGEQWPVNGMLPGPFLLRFVVVKGLSDIHNFAFCFHKSTHLSFLGQYILVWACNFFHMQAQLACNFFQPRENTDHLTHT